MSIIRTRAGLAICALPVALTLAVLPPQPASAQTLYADSFTSGTPGASLNGRAPQVDTTGATYTVSGNGGDVQYATGDAVFTPQGSSVNVFLPVTTNGAGIYSVSALVTPPTNPSYLNGAVITPANTDWIALGFAPSTNPLTEFYDAGPWMLYTATGATSVFGGPGTNNSSAGTNPATSQIAAPATETVIYNAATGVATYELNGTPIGTYTYATAPNISEAFIGQYGGANNTTQASFTALTVAATPEPSQLTGLALGVLGLSALALRARRRRTS